MKYRCLIMLLLITFAIAPVLAQVHYKNDFEKTNDDWWLGNVKDYNSYIEDGKLYLDIKYNSQYQINWKNFNIDYNKDYKINAEFRQLSGIDNHGYGFVWGTRGTSNQFYFIISSNGQATVYTCKNGQWKAIKPWTECSYINGMEETNIITIEQKDKRLKFLINGELFYESTGIIPFGDLVGFILNNTMEVEIDNLTIDYYDKKILLVDNPVLNITKENLGDNINSKYSDIAPIISADGNEIYYTRKADPDNIGDNDYDDIIYSKKDKSGNWTKAVRLGYPLNNNGSNGVTSLSADGNSMLLMNQYSEDGKSIVRGGISKSYRTADGWSIPTPITIEDYYNNNEYNWENQFLSSDNQVLIMSLEREDTYGKLDLYVCFYKDGKFTAPLNLGSVVNSANLDYAPFLAVDGKTLYFASSGHPGYGSDDIFMTRRLDDSWTNWTEPRNLGSGINSNATDNYFVIPASGEYAYIVSYQNTIGEGDLFRIKLFESAKPNPVVLVYGKVLDSKTKKAIGTTITVNNLLTNKVVATAVSDPKTGDYKIVLPYGEQYAFMAEKDSYYSVSENMNLTDYSSYKEIEKNLYLTPIEKGSVFRLNNVFFDYDKSDLRAESYPELDRLVDYLVANKTIKIEIAGHTDNQGTKEYNMKLSNNRAKSVENYLISKGIDVSRLSSKGYGPTIPIMDNATEEGRQSNRRVEAKILDK
ncbi:MAG TPA: OmpA family protein [Candidatus Kapabacteria bacterium]|nr:OmpA family protein [Candidatus Kapabacteria bacterium]